MAVAVILIGAAVLFAQYKSGEIWIGATANPYRAKLVVDPAGSAAGLPSATFGNASQGERPLVIVNAGASNALFNAWRDTAAYKNATAGEYAGGFRFYGSTGVLALVTADSAPGTADQTITLTDKLAITSSTGNVNAVTSFSIGAGTVITKHLSATASLDYAQASANTCETKTITVTGAADGNVVDLGVLHALSNHNTTSTFFQWVSAADTVTIRRCVITADGSDPAAATVRAAVWKH
jgi:hypothetical protein